MNDSSKEQYRHIMEAYVAYVLDKGRPPASVFKFCKRLEIEESEFYSTFSSLESVASAVWVDSVRQTAEVVQADGGFPPIRGSPLINCGRPLPWLTCLPAMAPVACTGIAIPPSYAPRELSYALTPWSGSTAIPLCAFPGRMH